jgi:hypothetical protein
MTHWQTSASPNIYLNAPLSNNSIVTSQFARTSIIRAEGQVHLLISHFKLNMSVMLVVSQANQLTKKRRTLEKPSAVQERHTTLQLH